MSVLIKGMELPKYKGQHKEFDRYGGFLTVYKNGKVELHIFDTDYTIESIPTPHGRLIDADNLKCPLSWQGEVVRATVREAQTIIEAEVSE